MATIKARVFRYDPSVDEAPRYEEYDIEKREWMTVLEILRTIHQDHDPTAFDYNCRGASCGMCTVKVDGKPCFACDTVVDTSKDEILIEPLDRLPIIRDLIVDKRVVKDRVLQTRPTFLRDTPMVNPQTMDKDSFLSSAILQQCRECLCCQTVCPAIEQVGWDNYAGPYVMTRIAQRYFDDREGHADERLRMAVNQGLFNCIECGMCTQVCPKGEPIRLDDYEYSFIDHVKYFKQMKEDARAKGLKPVEETPVRPIPEGSYTSAEKLSGA